MQDSRSAKKPNKPADAVDLAGHRPPSDTPIEAAVLGAILISKDAYTTVCDMLRPESFYDPRHALIYEAIQTLGASQQPIDFITVINQLEKNGTLD
ncbi:MAG: DnaB-like helicase N-terminal domain-containing protein, partial [Muribaculaceae bacterium]